MKERLKGKIHIGRLSGGDESLPIRIEVTDEISHTRVIEIRMSLEDFARAITSQYVDCEFRLISKVVGMKHEHKQVLVPFDYFVAGKKGGKEAREALAPFEVDGWKGEESDLFNHHRRDSKTNSQLVSFHRYLPTGEASGQ